MFFSVIKCLIWKTGRNGERRKEEIFGTMGLMFSTSSFVSNASYTLRWFHFDQSLYFQFFSEKVEKQDNNQSLVSNFHRRQ